MVNTNDRLLAGRLGRRDFMKYAGLMSGAGLLAACAKAAPTPSGPSGQSGSAIPPIESEPGDLRVFEWAGYEVPGLWKPYAKEFPDQKPDFVFFSTTDEALGKVRAGFRADVVHPCSAGIQDWVDLGVVQPFDPALLSHLPELSSSMVTAGQVDGKQYFIPLDWGFDAPLYVADKVQPTANSWELLYDERYAGKISWWDSHYMMIVDGYIQGFQNPWDMSDAELDSVKSRLIERKAVCRNFWSSQSELDADFASGNVDIAFAWPASWKAAKDNGLNAVYMEPDEGRLAYVCGMMLFADTQNYHHAHEFVNAWMSPQTAVWITNNYAYGHSNTNIDLAKIDPALVEAYSLDDPSILDEPRSHIERPQPRRTLYVQIWDEIKAA